MQKIALYKGTLMSLVLLEEKLASAQGLHVWECSCGSKFMTIYYASFHCEKYHKGDNFQKVISIKKELPTNTTLWNAFYTAASDIIVKTIFNEATVSSDTLPETKHNLIESDAKKTRKRENDNILKEDAVNAKRLKLTSPEVLSSTKSSEESNYIREEEKSISVDSDDHKLIKKEFYEDRCANSLSSEKFYENCVEAICNVSTQTELINSSTISMDMKSTQTELHKSFAPKMKKSVAPTTSPKLGAPHRFSNGPVTAKSKKVKRYSPNQHIHQSTNVPGTAFVHQNYRNPYREKPVVEPPTILMQLAPAMVMRPELPFPIPDPACFPYPRFDLFCDHSYLFHEDGTPTVFLWQKRAEYYMETVHRNMDPLVAREKWMQQNMQRNKISFTN